MRAHRLRERLPEPAVKICVGDLSQRRVSAQTLRRRAESSKDPRLETGPQAVLADALQVNAILRRSREAMASRLRYGIVRFARNTWRVELSEFGVS